jgi:UPF0176 protein
MNSSIVVAALYKFVALDNFQEMRGPVAAAMKRYCIKGTLLLAHEGINGTISGSRIGMDGFLAWLKSDERLADIEHKESFFDENPFYRTKVKLKKEIVTLGVETVDPTRTVGTYVEAKDWNALISDPDVLLIDTRNDYEVELGSFEGAVNPKTRSFTEFPVYVEKHLHNSRQRKVAMFCTGGIRCEKASSFMLSQGFEHVYHLKGGILKYLEEVPASESMWKGSCFVFDQRVGVGHGLQPSGDELCHGCRMPLRPGDKESPLFEEGVSCPRCHGTHSEASLSSARERQKQVKLAEQRGQPKPFGDGAR